MHDISSTNMATHITTERKMGTPDTDASSSGDLRSCNSSTHGAMTKNSGESWQPHAKHRDPVKAQRLTLSNI